MKSSQRSRLAALWATALALVITLVPGPALAADPKDATLSKEDQAVIRVSDNGPGIPEAILGKIFSPRFSTHGQHAGLGLHIVRTIVRETGGTVAAANGEKGAGAVFTITAPIDPASEAVSQD